MFRAFFAPLIRLDAFIQKRFDSVCFFLKRRFGLRKSFLRYALLAAVIVDSAASFAVEFSWGLRAPAWFLGNVAIIAMFAWSQRRAKRNDEAAEARPGTVSAEDRLPGVFIGGFKLFCLIEIVLKLCTLDVPTLDQGRLGWSVSQVRFDHALDVAWWIAYLLLMYLHRTPMNPPPETARESILAPKPAPAES